VGGGNVAQHNQRGGGLPSTPTNLTDPLAIQRFAAIRIRNAMFEEVQDVGIGPTEPENWASPVELSGTKAVSIITFVVGVVLM
jgi:hypothetical protein